jgi:hypothetical protein
LVIIVDFTDGKAAIFKTGVDLFDSKDIPPYTKLEYLEQEISELKEEYEHLRWLKSIPMEEREKLIHQNFDDLLLKNTIEQQEARVRVKQFHDEIKHSVKSVAREVVSLAERYGFDDDGNNEKIQKPFTAEYDIDWGDKEKQGATS